MIRKVFQGLLFLSFPLSYYLQAAVVTLDCKKDDSDSDYAYTFVIDTDTEKAFLKNFGGLNSQMFITEPTVYKMPFTRYLSTGSTGTTMEELWEISRQQLRFYRKFSGSFEMRGQCEISETEKAKF